MQFNAKTIVPIIEITAERPSSCDKTAAFQADLFEVSTNFKTK